MSDIDLQRLILDDNGSLEGIFKHHEIQSPSPARPMAFTGVAVYEPEFLNFLPQGVSSITDAWMRAVDAGHKIGAMDVSGCYWTDIGTPSLYAAAVVNALRVSGETIYIHPGVECRDIELDGYVVIEKGGIFSGVKSLRNCIILPISPSPLPLPSGERARVSGFSYENCILCGDIKIDLDEKDAQSDIFVRYENADTDLHRHIEYTQFFRRHNIPVPELMYVDYDNLTAVFEDLGDMTLYSWLKCKREKDVINVLSLRKRTLIMNMQDGRQGISWRSS